MELFSEYGHIDAEGKLTIYNKALLLERFKLLPSTSIEIIVNKREGTFTDQYRKYYFGVIVPHVQKAFSIRGYDFTRADTDNVLRGLFLSSETYNAETDTWEKEPRRLSAAETDVTFKEFQHFVDRVIRFAIEELEDSVPYPNEILK